MLTAMPVDTPVASGALHTLPVEYGGAAGPDLADLAQRAGMDVETYIYSHAAVEYTVAFLGFQPGFPYLRGLPAALRAPRRASPRVRVAAGSVAIGGGYCGDLSGLRPRRLAADRPYRHCLVRPAACRARLAAAG